MKTLFLTLVATVPIFAQAPDCRQITDTIYSVGVSAPVAMNGSLSLSLGYTAADGSFTVTQSDSLRAIKDGVLSVCLAPGNYQAKYSVSRAGGTGSVPSTRYWVIPSTGGPYTVAQVETSVAATPTLTVALSQLGGGGATNGQVPIWSTAEGRWIPGAGGGGGTGPATIRAATVPVDNGIKISNDTIFSGFNGPIGSALSVSGSTTGDLGGTTSLYGLAGFDLETTFHSTGASAGGGTYLAGFISQIQFELDAGTTPSQMFGRDQNVNYNGSIDGVNMLGDDSFIQNFSNNEHIGIIGDHRLIDHSPVDGMSHLADFLYGYQAELEVESAATDVAAFTAWLDPVFSPGQIVNYDGFLLKWGENQPDTTITNAAGIRLKSPGGSVVASTYNAIYQEGVSDRSTLEGFLILGPHNLAAITALSLPDYARFSCSDCKVTSVTANVVSNSTCAGSGGQSTGVAIGGILKCDYRP